MITLLTILVTFVCINDFQGVIWGIHIDKGIVDHRYRRDICQNFSQKNNTSQLEFCPNKPMKVRWDGEITFATTFPSLCSELTKCYLVFKNCTELTVLWWVFHHLLKTSILLHSTSSKSTEYHAWFLCVLWLFLATFSGKRSPLFWQLTDDIIMKQRSFNNTHRSLQSGAKNNSRQLSPVCRCNANFLRKQFSCNIIIIFIFLKKPIHIC